VQAQSRVSARETGTNRPRMSGRVAWAKMWRPFEAQRKQTAALWNASSCNAGAAAKKKKSGPGDPLLANFCRI